MSVIENYPALRPSLLLDFANSGRVHPLVRCVRASIATCFGADGKLRTAANNVPRIDHNPVTGKCLGLLVEEARTNFALNNTMQGAVAGAPGTLPTGWSETVVPGISRSIVGTGSEDGISYIDVRWQGTPTAIGNVGVRPTGQGAVAAVTGQQWVSSAFVRLVGGSFINLTPQIYITERPSHSGNSGSIAPTSQPLRFQRFGYSRALSVAGTTGIDSLIALSISTAGVNVDCTLRIGLPQIEEGAVFSSPIETAAAAVTRASEVTRIAAGLRKDQFSIQVIGVQAALASMTAVSIYSESDNSNYRCVNMSTGRSRIEATISGVNTNLGATQSDVVTGLKRNLAASYNGLSTSLSLNGLTAMSSPLSVSLSDADLLLGRASPTSTLSLFSGHIERVSLYPSALSDAQLQRLSRL